jgi:two-component system, OmpR family, KDP operon response regulator KdpE
MSNPISILVVDDEAQIRRLLKITLEAAGYRVHTAENGKEGIEQSAMVRPELIILDLGLPDIDGLAVLKAIREWSNVPALVLSVRSSEKDIVGALDSGANDYLTKPFRTGELLARVRAALRHSATTEEGTALSFGPIEVDFVARTVKKNGEVIKLTATEYSLFALLAHNAGKVLTHGYLLQQIWGPTFVEETQYLRVYIAQLRRKLEPNPTLPSLILTESGIGYRLVDNPQESVTPT